MYDYVLSVELRLIFLLMARNKSIMETIKRFFPEVMWNTSNAHTQSYQKGLFCVRYVIFHLLIQLAPFYIQ